MSVCYHYTPTNGATGTKLSAHTFGLFARPVFKYSILHRPWRTFVRAIYRLADVWIEIYSGIARFPCDNMVFVYAFALYCIARNTVACYMYLRTALLRLLPCRNIDRPMCHLPVESAFSLSLYLARITWSQSLSSLSPSITQYSILVLTHTPVGLTFHKSFPP